MTEGTVYSCSNGQYYGDVDVWEHLESGTWKPCLWNPESGEEWVEKQDGELLVLVPVSRSSLPKQVQTESVAAGISVSCKNREINQ